MTIKPENKKLLEEFIKRVEYTTSLSYLDGKDKIVGGEGRMVGDKWEINFFQPSDEKRDALLFNIRLFLQDKDDISLRRLAELYDDPEISNQWKREHEHYRKELNTRLDRIAVQGPNGKLIYRDILNMFLYGKFGHHDRDDKSYKLYNEWVTDNNYEIMHNTFHTVLVWILAVITNISIASREELQRHGTK